VRARPIFARARAGSGVTSRPNSSTVPDETGKSPQMTLKSVVLPAPFGPRIARRSPGAISRSTSRTACRPPKRRPTPRKRRAGSACSTTGAAVKRLLQDLVRDLAVGDDLDLALPRRLQLLARRLRAAGRRARRLEQAAERLIDRRYVRDDLRADRAVGVLDQLELVLVLDRLAAGVELHEAAVRDLERPLDRARQRRLELRSDRAAGALQALNQGLGRHVVVVDEAVVSRQLRLHLLHVRAVRVHFRVVDAG